MHRRLIVEAIGTFFLTLVAGLSGSPLAVGGVLAAMIYAGGPISGGHYNPAVSFGLLIRGKLTKQEMAQYWGAQMVGAILAAGMYWLLRKDYFLPTYGESVDWWTAVLAEAVFTFALVFVVQLVALPKSVAHNQYFGLAIGFTVMAGAYSVGLISGAAFNPAVGVGPQLLDIAQLNQHVDEILLYLVGPLVGGAAAAIVGQHLFSGKSE